MLGFATRFSMLLLPRDDGKSSAVEVPMPVPEKTPPNADPVADWRAKDMRARLAEEELRSAWNAYFEKRGPPPSAAFQAEVRRRRSAADESLAKAIQERQRSR